MASEAGKIVAIAPAIKDYFSGWVKKDWNIEYFNFINGKIRSIEVFFGGAGEGFPTNAK